MSDKINEKKKTENSLKIHHLPIVPTYLYVPTVVFGKIHLRIKIKNDRKNNTSQSHKNYYLYTIIYYNKYNVYNDQQNVHIISNVIYQ